jgi:hypothetical protein
MPLFNLNKKLRLLGDRLKSELQLELKLQKHRASNQLSESIELKVLQQPDKVVLRELHEFYGDYVDRGRAPGGKRVPLQALEEWVRLKGFAPGNEKSVAFLIQRKIHEEGIPTSESRGLAPRRLNWLTGTVERNTDRIELAVDEALILDFNVLIDDILARTNAKIRG